MSLAAELFAVHTAVRQTRHGLPKLERSHLSDFMPLSVRPSGAWGGVKLSQFYCVIVRNSVALNYPRRGQVGLAASSFGWEGAGRRVSEERILWGRVRKETERG